jgi:hypothetical protein
MDKESTYLLQLIDCNCNDCVFMERDFVTYQKWEDWHRKIDFDNFEKRKVKAIKDAEQIEDEKGREAQLRIANKMRFQFDKNGLLKYGNCTKFKKPVSFIPMICQLETQSCFEHRRRGEMCITLLTV